MALQSCDEVHSYPPVQISLPVGSSVCFWGGPPSAVTPSGDIPSQFAKSGYNTGNIFFGAGLYDSLSGVRKVYIDTSVTPPESLHLEHQYLFIPASNFANKIHDMSYLFDYLKKTKIQIFCFGLGSQFLPGEEVALLPGTESLIRLISDRSVSIGVRGSFTAEILWSLGIRNVDVVGCPSLLGLSNSSIELLASAKPSLTKVATSYSSNVRRHSLSPSAIAEIENRLFRFFLDQPSTYIIQNEQSELEYIQAVANGATADLAALAANVAHIFDVRDRRDSVDRYLRENLKVFFSPNEWISFMSRHTAAIGTRFHGNVAAVLAGVPALFITHDMRTAELCDFFKMPSIPATLDLPIEKLTDLLLQVNYDEFLANYKNVRLQWKAFMIRNGLDTSIATQTG